LGRARDRGIADYNYQEISLAQPRKEGPRSGEATHGFNRGNSHQSECNITNERSSGDELTAKTNGTDDRLDSDPKRDWKMEKIVDSEEELDDERNVFSL
jgi:hypothetical protein